MPQEGSDAVCHGARVVLLWASSAGLAGRETLPFPEVAFAKAYLEKNLLKFIILAYV